jgi:hypothetical protein
MYRPTAHTSCGLTAAMPYRLSNVAGLGLLTSLPAPQAGAAGEVPACAGAATMPAAARTELQTQTTRRNQGLMPRI